MRTTAMRMMMVCLALVLAPPVYAQTTPAPCPATPASLPRDLAGWAKGGVVADGGTLAIGTGATVTLVAAPNFAMAPGKPPAAGTFGGSVSFVIVNAGTYRIALAGSVWVDVVRDTKPVASSAHGHGPVCSPVRKMVDFTLTPGRYVLQLSNAKASFAPVMVTRL